MKMLRFQLSRLLLIVSVLLIDEFLSTKHFINKLRWLSVFRQKYFLDQGEHFGGERESESERHVWRPKHAGESKGHIVQSKREDEKEMR